MLSKLLEIYKTNTFLLHIESIIHIYTFGILFFSIYIIMKKGLLYGFLLSALVLAGCSSMDPVSYNDEIINPQIDAVNKYMAYDDLAQSQSLNTGDFAMLETERQKILTEIKASRDKVAAMKAFKDDASFRDVVVAYFDNMIQSLEGEEKELITLWTKWQADMKGGNSISDEDQTREQELLDAINTRDQAAYENLNKVQAEFSQKHNYTVKSSD